MNKNIFKKTCLMIVLFPIIFLFLKLNFSSLEAADATCVPDCSEQYSWSEYECNYGEMCCSGGGCPSFCCHSCCTSNSCGPFTTCCECGMCATCTQATPTTPTTTTTTTTTTTILAFFEGIIWGDDNLSGGKYPDEGEDFKGTTSISDSCSNKLHTGFDISVSGKIGNQISSWWCNSTYNYSYYKANNNIVVGSSFTATLGGLPSGYECDEWYYRDSRGDLYDKQGTGCTTSSITMPNTGWRNIIWRLKVSNFLPKGSHDGSTCIDTDGPNLRKITAWGWTCDPDDYSSSLAVHMYVDGNYAGLGTANNPAESGVATACGGFSNHRFNFMSTNSYSAGNHNVTVYAINTPAGNNPQLPSTRTVTCCTTVNGGWTSWSVCQPDGKQYRACTNPTPYCGGSPCLGDSSRSCAHITGKIWTDTQEGGIYPNTYNSAYDWYEAWSGRLVGACTSNVNANFRLRFNYTDDITTAFQTQIPRWGCASPHEYYETYSNTTLFTVPIDPKNGNVELSGLPAEYRCKSWSFISPLGSTGNSYVGEVKTVCNTNLTGLLSNTGLNQNNLTWEICKPIDGGWTYEWKTDVCIDETCGWGYYDSIGCFSPIPYCGGALCTLPSPTEPCTHAENWYYLDVFAKDIPPGMRDCDESTFLSIGNASVGTTIGGFKNNPSTSDWFNLGTPIPPVTGSDGRVRFSDILISQTALRLNANRTSPASEAVPDVWNLVSCVDDGEGNYKVTNVMEYGVDMSGDLDSDDLDWGCSVESTNLALQASYKSGWISAIDSDIFAGNGLDITVPLGYDEFQGFSKSLINSKDINSKGYVFSHTLVNEPSTPEKIFETGGGGNAYNLLESFSVDHKSKWLEDVSFDPPTHNEVIGITSAPEHPPAEPQSYLFTNGMVYKIDVDIFNEVFLPSPPPAASEWRYRVSGDGIAIVYVTSSNDSSTLNIDKNIVSKGGRIIIVSKPAIIVSSSVGTSDFASYTINQNPNIMAALLSKDQIYFPSNGIRDQDSQGGTDIPIMLTAPLASSVGISFDRDLGHDRNALVPAESVLPYYRYLYLLAALERSKSADYLYYTGLTLTTYDLDWEYIY